MREAPIIYLSQHVCGVSRVAVGELDLERAGLACRQALRLFKVVRIRYIVITSIHGFISLPTGSVSRRMWPHGGERAGEVHGAKREGGKRRARRAHTEVLDRSPLPLSPYPWVVAVGAHSV